MQKTVNQAEFARLIGKSRTYVGKLVKRGLPVTRGGKIDPDAGKRWLAENVKTKEPEEPKEDISRAEAERRLSVAKAEKAELELAEARGELVRAEDVASTWGGHIAAAKARMLLIETRMAPRIGAEELEVLKREIDQVLTELSEYRS